MSADPVLTSPVDADDTGVVLEEAPSGLPIITLPTPLTGLHYFDGQAMRDARVTAEQQYRRSLAKLAARAAGYGIANGFTVRPGPNDEIVIGGGLAVDGLGRVLQLAAARSISMTRLIAASSVVRREALMPSTSLIFRRCIERLNPRAPAARTRGDCWVVTLSWIEQSGWSRYGTVTREGVRVRAVPLVLQTPLVSSKAVKLDARVHLRSLIASAAFADEWTRGNGLISGEGLKRGAWCLGAHWDPRADIPIAVVAVAGGELLFVDEWIVRRERHEAPPARYWAGLMRMRPWSAYLAQILQFQCQLANRRVGDAVVRTEGCGDVRDTLGRASQYLSHVYDAWQTPHTKAMREITLEKELESGLLERTGGATRLELLMRDVTAASENASEPLTDRLLIRNGFVELPPAGYLPVKIGATPTVNDQVHALMGEGVELRFCIVHPDVIPRELEKGQHMERISLLQGLDNTGRKPDVDIFVPDGIALDPPPPSDRFAALARIKIGELGEALFRGVARRETLPTGGAALYMAASGIVAQLAPQITGVFSGAAASEGAIASDDALWISARSDKAIRTLGVSESARLTGRAIIAAVGESVTGPEITFDGDLVVRATRKTTRGARLVNATIDGRLALMDRRASTDAETTVLFARRLAMTAEIRWHETDTEGEMSARIFARPTSIRRQRHLTTVATVQKRSDRTRPLTVVTIRSALPLLDLLRDDVAVSAPSEPVMGANPDVAIEEVAHGIVEKPPEQFVMLELVESADVVSVENPLHVLATAAVRDVQTLLVAEQTFARDAMLSLFPPPPKNPELLVQATRDWVLFRRRRTNHCFPSSDSVTVGRRRFRLFSLRVENTEASAAIVERLRASGTAVARALRSAIAPQKDAPLVLVEFPRDGAAPLAAPQELRDAWVTLDPGACIAAGVIATTGTEGPSLLQQRLRALTPLLAPVSSAAPTAPMVAFPTAPTGPVTLDADGIILLVTVSCDAG